MAFRDLQALEGARDGSFGDENTDIEPTARFTPVTRPEDDSTPRASRNENGISSRETARRELRRDRALLRDVAEGEDVAC